MQPDGRADHNNRHWTQIAQCVRQTRLAASPALVHGDAVIQNVARRRHDRSEDQKLVHGNRADHRQSQNVHVDIGTKDSTQKIDQQGDHLTFCNTNVTENEGSSEILFPLRRVEGYQHGHNKGKQQRHRTNTKSARHRETNEDRGERIAAVVEKFAEWRASTGTAGLLAVQGVQSLVQPHTQEIQHAQPLRHRLRQRRTVTSRQNEARQTRHEACKGDEIRPVKRINHMTRR